MVLIEEQAHTDHVNIVTAACGPLPEALALVLPDSELPAVHFESCHRDLMT
jgi:hypothetical protein